MPNPISTVDTRKELADTVGLGERTMGKVMQIDEHAPAAVKEALDKKELSIHQGYQITKQVENLPEEQREQAALEAVELAKGFGGEDDSPRFVNGVLGRIARSMEGDGAGAADAVGADIAAAGPVDALVGASGAAACVQVGV